MCVSDRKEFLKWKRKNVSLRGMNIVGETNGVYPSFGSGLYTAFLSYKDLAKQYGKVYFVVGGKPLNPLKLNNSNEAEIFRQKFKNWEGMKKAILRKGFDGMAIIGREYCYYKKCDPIYFENESNLFDYYLFNIKNNPKN